MFWQYFKANHSRTPWTTQRTKSLWLKWTGPQWRQWTDTWICRTCHGPVISTAGWGSSGSIFTSLNAKELNRWALQRVVQSAEHTIHIKLPHLRSIYSRQCWTKAREILKGLSQPNNEVFSLLSQGNSIFNSIWGVILLKFYSLYFYFFIYNFSCYLFLLLSLSFLYMLYCVWLCMWEINWFIYLYNLFIYIKWIWYYGKTFVGEFNLTKSGTRLIECDLSETLDKEIKVIHEPVRHSSAIQHYIREHYYCINCSWIWLS